MAWYSFFLKAAFIDKAIEYLPKIIKSVQNFLRGKNIAIIGATASGKNAMFDMLQNKEISSEYNQTRGIQELDTFKIRYTLPNNVEVNFTLKKCKNVGGEEDQRDDGNWRVACKDADIIFYLIDTKKLLDSPIETMQRIKDDLKWVSQNFPAFHLNKVFHLLLNKVDLLLVDIPVEDQESYLNEKLEMYINELENFTSKIFSQYSSRVTGVHPISMTDNYTFNKYFPTALIDIVKKVEANE